VFSMKSSSIMVSIWLIISIIMIYHIQPSSSAACPCAPDITTGANGTYCASWGTSVARSCSCTNPTCVVDACVSPYSLVSQVACSTPTGSSTKTCQLSLSMIPCSTCVPGRWGPAASCKNICPGGVATPCTNRGTCDQATGVCTCSDAKWATPSCATCSTNCKYSSIAHLLRSFSSALCQRWCRLWLSNMFILFSKYNM
jgi:hypothetical protein